MPWRLRISNVLWFGRSVRTQILIVFIAINLIAASMRLAELMVSEAVQLIQQGIPAEQFLKALPGQLRFVRHVRVRLRDASGTPISDQTAERSEFLREDSRAAAPA